MGVSAERKKARAAGAGRHRGDAGPEASVKGVERLSGNELVVVPGHLLSPRGGDYYVLRVVGDELEDEAIREGDFVIVLRRTQVELGEMVVAIVGDEATIKRYYPAEDGKTVRLQPANGKLPPQILPAADVKVQGIVVGLMRKF